MLQVKQIVNEVFSSNTYVVFDEDYNYCWLVDIGDFQKVTDALPPNIEIRGVFLTHVHFDHIYGANMLHEAFPKSVIYTNAYGHDALYNDKKNFSLYHESSFVYEGKEVIILGERGSLEISPNVYIDYYTTPGHSNSCITYVVQNWVFTGDSYIPGIKVVTKLPGGDRTLAKESQERILLLARNKTICPGHGEMTSQRR